MISNIKLKRFNTTKTKTANHNINHILERGNTHFWVPKKITIKNAENDTPIDRDDKLGVEAETSEIGKNM